MGRRRLPAPLRRARGEWRRRPRRSGVRDAAQASLGTRRRVRDRTGRDRAGAPSRAFGRRRGGRCRRRPVDARHGARANGPEVEWHEHDLTTLDLGRVFDVVVLAGNVPLFTPPGTQRALVRSCARHVGPGGVLDRRLPTRTGLRARRVRPRLPHRGDGPLASGSRPGRKTRSGPAPATPCRSTRTSPG